MKRGWSMTDMYIVFVAPWKLIIIAITLVCTHALITLIMDMEMREKGYGLGKIHTIGIIICVLFGFFGFIYVAALPNTKSKERLEKIYKMLDKSRGEETDVGDD